MIQHCGPKERGETLLGVLAGLLIASIVMAAAVTNFSDAWRRASDTRMMAQAETEARTLLDVISYDIRMLGSGMPLGQAGFAMSDASLGTAPLPILTTSTATSIVFRMNEKGTQTLLTNSFVPSASLTMNVVNSSDFATGDTVYLSNMTQLGTAGFRGSISSVGANTITLNNTYVTTPSTTFSSGCTVDKVNDVTFQSATGGITRSMQGAAVLLSPRSSFTARYLTSAGAPIALPLTVTAIRDDLASIELTVRVSSPRPLLDGQIYTSQAIQTVALRNLNLSR